MTNSENKSLTVVDLPVDKVRPNSWNTNRVPAHIYAKLKQYVRREGLLEPVIVRPVEGEMFELVGGEHRWRIARELGWLHIPAAIVQLDDRRARIASVNLNSLKGDNIASLLAELVHDLSKEASLADLASELPWDETELDDLLRLLELPQGFADDLAAEAEKAERERPRVVAFSVSAQQEVIISEAIARALVDVAGVSRGAALTTIARAYLGEKP